MRKHVLLLIAALLAVVLTLWACAQNITEKPAPTGEEAVSGGETQPGENGENNGTGQAGQPGENGENNGTGQNSGVPEYLTQDPTVHYVRIRWDRDTYISSFNRDFYASDSNLMISAQMIDGLSDLKAFIDKYSEVLLLDRSVDGVPAFTETVKKYDEAFFKDNIIVICMEQTSRLGYFYPRITAVRAMSFLSMSSYNTECVIDLVAKEAEDYYCDVQTGWLVIKEMTRKETASYRHYFYKPGYGTAEGSDVTWKLITNLAGSLERYANAKECLSENESQTSKLLEDKTTTLKRILTHCFSENGPGFRLNENCASVMRELLEMCDPGSAFDTSRLQVSDISGRQYMDEWIASTLKERGDHSKEWFEENCPAKALFYEMYDRAKQFIEK